MCGSALAMEANTLSTVLAGSAGAGVVHFFRGFQLAFTMTFMLNLTRYVWWRCKSSRRDSTFPGAHSHVEELDGAPVGHQGHVGELTAGVRQTQQVRGTMLGSTFSAVHRCTQCCWLRGWQELISFLEFLETLLSRSGGEASCAIRHDA